MFHSQNVSLGFLIGSVCAAIWLLSAVPAGARPDWRAALLRPVASVVTGLAVYGVLRALGAPLLAVAILTAAAAGAWVLPEVTRMAQRQFRGASL